MGDWGVTTAEVLAETGQTVSSQTLAIGSNSVEVFLNCTPGASAVLMPRDLHWITTAIKWQAAWLNDQPGFTSRVGVTSYSSEGSRPDPLTDESAISLAPMAKRALKNVSWKGSRTLQMLDQRWRLGQRPVSTIPFQSSNSDDWSNWRSV